MPLLGFEVDDTEELNSFMEEMQEKLKSPDLFQNPFTGFINKNKYKGTYLMAYLHIIWINTIYIALMLTITLFLVYSFSFSWVHLFLIPLWLGSFMFTKTFTKIAMYFSLRKHGYKGKIKFMDNTTLLLRLVKWGKEKY